ncbi:hypothetical protein AVEN_191765-1 [Araneus ventricosus]|uniref:Integrase catalytic domain-containing protein n=1 Tax=Araneus ventricosus TaxID=182803 RepID=A0A4Y2VE52_ARAVE|nr:hypothetical protein AVEN_191765-1 [Araneus ventricosus]
MQTHKIPELPGERVSVDLFEKNRKYYLVLVDHYSDYFEADQLTCITSNSKISECKHHFNRHGIPKISVSDNGQRFCSAEFAEKWQFNQSTSSPYYREGNGKAEPAVKIVMNS